MIFPLVGVMARVWPCLWACHINLTTAPMLSRTPETFKVIPPPPPRRDSLKDCKKGCWRATEESGAVGAVVRFCWGLSVWRWLTYCRVRTLDPDWAGDVHVGQTLWVRGLLRHVVVVGRLRVVWVGRPIRLPVVLCCQHLIQVGKLWVALWRNDLDIVPKNEAATIWRHHLQPMSLLSCHQSHYWATQTVEYGATTGIGPWVWLTTFTIADQFVSASAWIAQPWFCWSCCPCCTFSLASPGPWGRCQLSSRVRLALDQCCWGHTF